MNESDPERQVPKPPAIHLVAPFVIAGVTALLGVWLWYARPSFWGLTLGGWTLAELLLGIAGAVLVFTLAGCLLILLGHPPVMTLSPLLPSTQERARWREMRSRPMLTDEEFYERFYGDTGIAKGIALRLRRVYAIQLAMDRVRPGDKATEFDGELDLADLLAEVEEEFNVQVSHEEALKLDGSFDSIARLVASKLGLSRPEQ